MTDIFPAEGQLIGDIITDLQAMGFVDGRDFRLHYTWDMRPYIQAGPDTYERWASERVDSTEDEKAPSAEASGDSSGDSDSGDSDDGGDSTGSGGNARRSGKQRR